MDVICNNKPHQMALTLNGDSYSYAELDTLINDMSCKLRSLPPGIIALSAAQSFEFIIQALAAIKNEQPILLQSNGLSIEEKNNQLRRIKNIITCDKGNLIAIEENPNGYSYHPKTAVILFTSGSQGLPKAVQLSYQNIQANADAIIKALDFSSVEEQLLFLPLCYSYGFFGQLIPALMVGAHTYFINDFSSIGNLLMSEKTPQMWSGVPSHWTVLHQLFSHFPETARQITHIISAGDKLNLSLRYKLHKQFSNAVIYNNYGLTEASPRVLTLKSTDENFFSDAVGYPIGDWQIKLSNTDELLIKGSQVMIGYLGEQSPTKMSEGWLHTGDLAQINENQLVTIKGRVDQIINIGGEKIDLSYIENLLKQVIKDLVVLSQDDELHGQRLTIVVDKSSEQTQNQLRETINKAMPHWQKGFELRIVDAFPRNSRGKLDRNALKNIILSRSKND